MARSKRRLVVSNWEEEAAATAAKRIAENKRINEQRNAETEKRRFEMFQYFYNVTAQTKIVVSEAMKRAVNGGLVVYGPEEGFLLKFSDSKKARDHLLIYSEKSYYEEPDLDYSVYSYKWTVLSRRDHNSLFIVFLTIWLDENRIGHPNLELFGSGKRYPLHKFQRSDRRRRYDKPCTYSVEEIERAVKEWLTEVVFNKT